MSGLSDLSDLSDLKSSRSTKNLVFSRIFVRSKPQNHVFSRLRAPRSSEPRVFTCSCFQRLRPQAASGPGQAQAAQVQAQAQAAQAASGGLRQPRRPRRPGSEAHLRAQVAKPMAKPKRVQVQVANHAKVAKLIYDQTEAGPGLGGDSLK